MKLARQSAATWKGIRREAFLGTLTIETANRVYRFEDGIFAGRAPKGAPGATPAWEAPLAMRGVELIGFLADEGGLWSLSTRWRPGAMAVLATSNHAFTLTSPTCTCSILRPAKRAEPPPSVSAVRRRPSSRPPLVRRPAPPSLTRIQALPAT